MDKSSVAKLTASQAGEIIRDVTESQEARGPDLVVTGKDGHQYVIEIKVGDGRTHFSEIAQVDSIGSEFREGSDDPDADVSVILLTNRDVPDRIRTLADAVGVDVVEAGGSQEADFASALARHLQAQGDAPA